MRFGDELERWFLISCGELEPTPAQDRILHDIAATLGGRGRQPSISRNGNCVAIDAKHRAYFPIIRKACALAGLRELDWRDGLRIFVV